MVRTNTARRSVLTCLCAELQRYLLAAGTRQATFPPPAAQLSITRPHRLSHPSSRAAKTEQNVSYAPRICSEAATGASGSMLVEVMKKTLIYLWLKLQDFP